MYGLLAKHRLPDDRSRAIFNINPEARWHDGEPVTADDVIFSHDPYHSPSLLSLHYADIVEIEAGSAPPRMIFSEGDSLSSPSPARCRSPALVGGRDFSRAILESPRERPYRVAGFEANRYVTYQRVEDYWGRSCRSIEGASMIAYAMTTI